MFTTPVSWKRSLLVAAISCYAPFLLCMVAIDVQMLPSIAFSATGRSAMGTTDLLIVHMVCLVGPSLLPFWLASQFLPWADANLLIVMAIPTVAAILIGIAALGRLGREWLVAGATAAFLLNAIAAFYFYSETT